MTNFQHIHPQFRNLMSLSDADRLASIKPHWIDYEFAVKIFDELKSKLDGHRDQPDFLILGDSRMGKTTLVKHFIDYYAPEFINSTGMREIPALMIEVDQPNAKQLLIEILNTSISPFNPSSTVEKLFCQVINLLQDCNTKMLIIDEFQSLAQGTAREVTAIARLIKRISNKTGVSIIGVGVKAAKQFLTKDEQYTNRFVTKTIPNWTASPAFRQFLKGFEAWLPLKEPSTLSSKEIATFILTKTGGNTSRVEELLLSCARKAIKTGRERIDLELLGQSKWTTDSSGIREVAL